jgi:hypothetical protein
MESVENGGKVYNGPDAWTEEGYMRDTKRRENRVYRKGVLRIFFLLWIIPCSFALGTKESDFQKTEGGNNWEKNYDISGMSPGKYNLIIRAEDNAGNVSTAGPFNVYVDPSSDLPVVSISSPTSGMRVGGSLTGVGTCVDDDGVDHVEVQLDGGDFVKADGKEFWSCGLDLSSVADGRHTITARGIDINGVIGESVSVTFNLDTMSPVIAVTSHKSGAIVSGSIKLAGTVSDANNVRNLFSSSDNGETYREIPIRWGKDHRSGQYELPIDTKKLADGSYIYWFKATDETGSTGYAAFLVFVDNTGPALEFLSPKPEEKSNGKVVVVGKITERIGIQSFAFDAGEGNKGTIELVPGDPYWSQEFDFSKARSPSVRISFTVIDLIGNRTTKDLTVGLLQDDADLPALTLRTPVSNGSYSGAVVISGAVRDDDGVKGISYSFDGKAPVVVDCAEAFSIPVSDLPSGKHKLAIHGIDIYGRAGKDTTVEFTSLGKPPVVTLESVTNKKGSEAFKAGLEIAREEGNVLAGRIATLDAIASVEYSLNGGPAQKIEAKKSQNAGESTFEIRLPQNIPFGLVTLSVKVKDQFGQEGRLESLLHVTNYTKRNVEPGIYFTDPRIQSDGTVYLSTAEPLVGVFAGEEIKTVSIEPATNVVSVSSDGDSITVSARSAATSAPVHVKVVSTKNHVFTSQDFRFNATDENAGALPLKVTSISSGGDSKAFYPGMMAAAGGSVVLKGTAAIAAQVKSSEYSFQGGQARGFGLNKKAEGQYTFEIPVPNELPFGKVDLRVTATDATGGKIDYVTAFYKVEKDAGNVNDAEGIFFADSRIGSGPILLAPGEAISGYFNGRPVKDVKLEPEGSVVSASFDGRFIAITASKEGTQDGVRLHLSTMDGDSFQSDTFSFSVDAEPPRISITSPQSGLWVGTGVVLKGAASDTNGIKKVEYALNSEETFTAITPQETGAGFEVSVDLKEVPDGDVGIALRAEDVAGRTSIAYLQIMKDTAPPQVSLLTPPEGEAVNGLITVTGAVADAGIVESVEFSDDGVSYKPVSGTAVFSMPLDFSKYEELPEKFYFRANDRSGNQYILSAAFDVQQATDVPQVQIQIPRDGEVLRGDFTISGMVFDDDGIGAISYRIDERDWEKLESSNSFSVPVSLETVDDNEHTIEVKAEDLNGVSSEVRTSSFKISKAEPTSKLVSPALSTTTHGIITLSGESADKNGIMRAFVSFDNGRTFNLAEGKEAWTYRLDTRILKDGTYSLLIKAEDAYGTTGLYFTLLNIDNSEPQITLDAPKDGAVVTDSMTLDGRGLDNIALTSLKASLTPLGAENAQPKTFDLPAKGNFSFVADLAGLGPGWYDLVIEGVDRAENSAKVTRSILIQEKKLADRVDILFPVNGESLSGTFTFAGRVQTSAEVREVGFSADGKSLGTIPVNSLGYFSTGVTTDMLGDGTHVLEVQAALPGDVLLSSESRTVAYTQLGPWVRITSHAAGDFASSRPFIKGEAGYVLAPVDPADKEAVSKQNRERDAHRITRVEMSLDNGRSFLPVSGTEKWQFRLETQNFPDGEMRLMAHAVFADGSEAFDETMLTIDETPPQVVLLTPREEGRFNNTIPILGTAHDENGIRNVVAAVRQGDKSAYEVPGFIQGLYFDGHALGSTLAEVGVGLTFFDDAVKLQAQVGFNLSDEERFSGLFIGAKLLANIFRMPFSFFLGPDWDWLSMSLSLGADFSYVTNSGSSIAFTDRGLILGGVVGQLEFPIIKNRAWAMFNTYSLYTEYQLWFISSDVQAGIISKMAFGVRLGLF